MRRAALALFSAILTVSCVQLPPSFPPIAPYSPLYAPPPDQALLEAREQKKLVVRATLARAEAQKNEDGDLTRANSPLCRLRLADLPKAPDGDKVFDFAWGDEEPEPENLIDQEDWVSVHEIRWKDLYTFHEQACLLHAMNPD